MKKNLVKSIALLFISSLIFVTCKKDRIEDEPLKEYKSYNEYFDSKKQQEQEYIIDTNGTCPLVAKYGTRICISKTDLEYPNKLDNIYFPYKLKIIELYSTKDMIYYQMPSVGGESILSTSGEIRVRAFKDTTELQLKSSTSLSVTMPRKDAFTEMKQYYGSLSSSIVDWISTPVGSFSNNDTSYIADVQKLGWFACSKDVSNSSSATISFTSGTDNLANVAIFIYVPAVKALMQVRNLTSGKIPVGNQIKIIAIAVDSSDKLFHFYKEMTLGQNNETLDISLSEISDSDLTTKLDAL